MIYLLPPLENCNNEILDAGAHADLPPASINGASAALVADPPFHRALETLCARGPRLPVELLAELAIEYDIEAAIRKKLRRYLDIPDNALDLAGARQLPPSPIHAVHGGKP